jgi:hypothetical protein
MKKFLTSKKGIVLLVTAIAAIVAAVGAYAYWTSTGTHTASPVTAGGVGSLAVAYQTASYLCNDGGASCTALAPASLNDKNAGIGTVPFTIINNDETVVKMTHYTVAVDALWNVAGTGGNPNCDASDFSINGGAAGATFDSAVGSGGTGFPPVAIGPLAAQTLQPLSDAPANEYDGSYNVQLVDKASNQDACKGAKPSITLTTFSS